MDWTLTVDWTPVFVAFISILPTTLVALFGWRATQRVHTIVNSQRTDMTEKIESLMEKISRLERDIAVSRSRSHRKYK